jgi:hypothetical protein
MSMMMMLMMTTTTTTIVNDRNARERGNNHEKIKSSICLPITNSTYLIEPNFSVLQMATRSSGSKDTKTDMRLVI